jgi:hypothetical protein
MADDVTLNTLSLNSLSLIQETKVKKTVLDSCGKCYVVFWLVSRTDQGAASSFVLMLTCLCFRRRIWRINCTTAHIDQQRQESSVVQVMEDLTDIGVHESPVRSSSWQQAYQYKPLPSQLIYHQEMDEDSNATVLKEDDDTLNTFSPCRLS